MNTFFSHVCKVPRTLKNMLTRTSSPNSASDTKHKPKKRTKQYWLPTSADRKKAKASAAATSSGTNKTLESGQAMPITNGTELPKSETTTTKTATTLESSDMAKSNENASPTTTPEEAAVITRNKHGSYYEELLAENDIDSLSISSASDGESDDEDESLTPGDRRWKLQRKAWLKPHPDVATPPRPSVVKHMSEAERITVYKYLVVNNRRLREPISLSDALIVLRSGWVASGQCPVFAVATGAL